MLTSDGASNSSASSSASDSSADASSSAMSRSTDNSSSLSRYDGVDAVNWFLGDFLPDDPIDEFSNMMDVGGSDAVSEIWKSLFEEESQQVDDYFTHWLKLQRLPRGEKRK
jgi:hypothetical protein